MDLLQSAVIVAFILLISHGGAPDHGFFVRAQNHWMLQNRAQFKTTPRFGGPWNPRTITDQLNLIDGMAVYTANHVKHINDDVSLTKNGVSKLVAGNLVTRLNNVYNRVEKVENNLTSKISRIMMGNTAASKNKVQQIENVNKRVGRVENALSDKIYPDLETIKNKQEYQQNLLILILRKLYPASCSEAPETPKKKFVEILAPNLEFGKVRCENGWTVILSRESGIINFNRTYKEYEIGFGAEGRDFYIGNSALSSITNSKKYKLLVKLEDFYENRATSLYNKFKIGGKETSYMLEVGEFDESSEAGDGLVIHNGMKFSTYDVDNDKKEGGSCSVEEGSGGGWWYNDCYDSLGTGLYRPNTVRWYPWRERQALKSFKLLIRAEN